MDLAIQRVRFYEISAKAAEESSDESTVEATYLNDDPGDKLDIEMGIRDETSSVGFRLTADYSDDHVTARIDCAVFFAKPETRSDEYSPNDLAKFGAEHGIPILIPYLREALAESTRRVAGKPVMLGLVRVGDMHPVDESGR